jgi:hypothetical protein
MNTFLKILRVFFVILGIVFFLIIATGFYLYQSDFYGIKTITNMEQGETIDIPDNDGSSNTVSGSNNTVNEAEDKNPSLSAEQEAQLEAIGVDPAEVPSEITPEMEDCFIQKLGEERVRAIEAGASPTTLELIKVEPCL